MRIFLIILLIQCIAHSKENRPPKDLDAFIDYHWEIGKNERKSLLDGDIMVDIVVDDDKEKKQQSFNMRVIGIHKKTCSRVLRKISRFEKLSNWLNFVDESDYNEERKMLTLKANHMLLPYPMIVNIFIKRPATTGMYPFMFPTGIFTGLTGKLYIEEYKSRCTFFAKSSWKGPDTGISNFAIDLFATTLTKLGAEMLIRKTQF